MARLRHIAVVVKDLDKAADFYAKVFGWSIRQRGDGATAFDDGVGQVSGVWELHRLPAVNPGILVYIMVDDAAATLQRITAEGGDIVQPIGGDPGEVTARFRDPGGNVLGIYQGKS